MFYLVLTVVLVVGGLLLLKWQPERLGSKSGFVGGAMLVAAVLTFFSTSFVIIGQDSVGHLKRVYFGDPLPKGAIVAPDDSFNGPQAEILGPGLTFKPFLNVIYDVEEWPVQEIKDGQLGVLTARDGRPLRSSQYLADPWEDVERMLDAKTFLTEGGQKGTQLTVLKPGKYRYNQYLFEMMRHRALEVADGHVAVIKSNVAERDDCHVPVPGSKTNQKLSASVVDRGCIGVWDEPLMPGKYFLNPVAYKPIIVPTRVQKWEYKGGYSTRQIDLTIGDNGEIQQKEIPIEAPVPKEAADQAIRVITEGWPVPLEMRMAIQVAPRDAPRVVAAVGNLQEVENKIATPALRSVMRNITGEEGRKVMDLIEKREQMEASAESVLEPELFKAGVTLKEIRFGDPVIPPELLLTRQREQLATQMRQTYEQEREAQLERIEREKAKAEADQQSELVKAEIGVQRAEQEKERMRLLGEGEKLRLSEIAKGQDAQVAVLGRHNAMQLAVLTQILDAAKENADIIKVPTSQILVQGEASADGLNSMAAILGGSNIAQGIMRPVAPADRPGDGRSRMP